MTLCPGQDTRYWKPEDVFTIACGTCGTEVEFFRDDTSRRCPACGTVVRNPRISMGCAQWCEHARECLGYDPRATAQGEADGQVSLLDALTAAVRERLADEPERLAAAETRVAAAQELLGGQPVDRRIVLAAALLRDLDPGTARELLAELGFDPVATGEVCGLLAEPGDGADTDARRILAAAEDRTAT